MNLIKKKGNTYFIDCLEYGITTTKHTLVLRNSKDGEFRLGVFPRRKIKNAEYVPELTLSNKRCGNFKICYSKHGSLFFIFKSGSELKTISFFEVKTYTIEDSHLVINQIPDHSIITVAPNNLKVKIPISL